MDQMRFVLFSEKRMQALVIFLIELAFEDFIPVVIKFNRFTSPPFTLYQTKPKKSMFLSFVIEEHHDCRADYYAIADDTPHIG